MRLADRVSSYALAFSVEHQAAAETISGSGIIVYLQEELTDARLRCEQLKKYIAEAVKLVQASEMRDHFHEVAGHLLHGIPDTLFKLDKALSATALAATRLDYESLKQALKPEKAEELERVLEDARITQVQRRSNAVCAKGQDAEYSALGSTIMGAMKAHSGFPLQGGEVSSITGGFEVSMKIDYAQIKSEYKKLLAKAGINNDFKMHLKGHGNVAFLQVELQGPVDYDTQARPARNLVYSLMPHLKYINEKFARQSHTFYFEVLLDKVAGTVKAASHGVDGRLEVELVTPGPLLVVKVTGLQRRSNMGPKDVAAALNSMADMMESTGDFPLAEAVNIIATLEEKSAQNSRLARIASITSSGKVPPGYIRAMAESVINCPNRARTAGILRTLVADIVGSTELLATLNQAGSREDVMDGFKKENPDLTDEQLEEIADQWEKNKDVVKDKQASDDDLESGAQQKSAARYSGDPRWIKAKYPGVADDGTPFKKGEEVLYWPSSRTFQVGAKAKAAYAKFQEEAADEAFYNREYMASSKTAEAAPNVENDLKSIINKLDAAGAAVKGLQDAFGKFTKDPQRFKPQLNNAQQSSISLVSIGRALARLFEGLNSEDIDKQYIDEMRLHMASEHSAAGEGCSGGCVGCGSAYCSGECEGGCEGGCECEDSVADEAPEVANLFASEHTAGSAQDFLTKKVDGWKAGDSSELSDLARGYKGHFKELMSAASVLKKKGIIDFDGHKVTKKASDFNWKA